MSNLKAVILIGGPGTRLRPLTYDTPKSMVPLLNRPFLEHTITYLKQFGIKDIILALNYLPDIVRGYFGDGSTAGVRLAYSVENNPMGTAGAVKNVAKHLDGTFIVLNGDVFTDLDINEMLASHRQRGATATLALYQVDNPEAFGVVETDAESRIRRFIEKPPPGEATTDWINAGAYILEPEALQYVPPDTHYMFENGLFPDLLAKKKPCYGYRYEGYWIDMGTPEKYLALSHDLLLNKTNSPLINATEDGIIRGQNVVIHPTAELAAPVIIGDNCRLERGVHIKGPAVLGTACHLDEGTSVENSVLWSDITIGARARLRQCIVGNGASIEPGKELSDCVHTLSETAPLAL